MKIPESRVMLSPFSLLQENSAASSPALTGSAAGISPAEWARTPKMGVNTLAFRVAQNEAFYMVDADCVGILNHLTPWEKNKQWLHLLSYSNTPLFVSCTDEIPDECKEDLRTAYKVFNEEKPHEFEPVDIYDERIPSKWKIDGKIVEYDWK